MSDDPLQVSIKILEKDYRIACPPQDQEDLRASARLLDQRMRDIRQHGRVVGTDRIAVMAGLNIAHDLIQLQRAQPPLDEEEGRRLLALQERIAAALVDEATGESPPATADELDALGERV